MRIPLKQPSIFYKTELKRGVNIGFLGSKFISQKTKEHFTAKTEVFFVQKNVDTLVEKRYYLELLFFYTQYEKRFATFCIEKKCQKTSEISKKIFS